MADKNYDEIKTEYISSGVSLSSLAKKHKITYSVLHKRATKEKWNDLRDRIVSERDRKVEESIIDYKTAIAENCIKALTILASKVIKNAEMTTDDDTARQRQIAGILKDMRDMGAFEINPEAAKDNSITVRFEVDDYGE